MENRLKLNSNSFSTKYFFKNCTYEFFHYDFLFFARAQINKIQYMHSHAPIQDFKSSGILILLILFIFHQKISQKRRFHHVFQNCFKFYFKIISKLWAKFYYLFLKLFILTMAYIRNLAKKQSGPKKGVAARSSNKNSKSVILIHCLKNPSFCLF